MVLPGGNAVPMWADPESPIPYTVIAYPMARGAGGQKPQQQQQQQQQRRRSDQSRESAERRRSADEQQLSQQLQQQQRRRNSDTGTEGTERRTSRDEQQLRQQVQQQQQQRRSSDPLREGTERRTAKEDTQLRLQQQQQKQQQQHRRNSEQSAHGSEPRPSKEEQHQQRPQTHQQRRSSWQSSHGTERRPGKEEQPRRRSSPPTGQQVDANHARGGRRLSDNLRNIALQKDADTAQRVEDAVRPPYPDQQLTDARPTPAPFRDERDSTQLPVVSSEDTEELVQVVDVESGHKFKKDVQRAPKGSEGAQKPRSKSQLNRENNQQNHEGSPQSNVLSDQPSVSGVRRLTKDIQDVFYKGVESLQKVQDRISQSKDRINRDDVMKEQSSGKREIDTGPRDVMQNIWKPSETAQSVYQTETDGVETTAGRVFRNPEELQRTGLHPQDSAGPANDQKSLQGTEKNESSEKGSAIKKGFRRLSQNIQDAFHKSKENLHRVGSRTRQSKDRIPHENEDEMRGQTGGERGTNREFQEFGQDIWKRPDTELRVYQAETDGAENAANRAFRNPEVRQTSEVNQQGFSGQEPQIDQASLQGTDNTTISEKGSAFKRGFRRLSHNIKDAFHKSMENLHRIGSKTHHSKERISNENEDALSGQTTDERDRNRELQDTVQDIWKRPDTVQRVYLTEPDNVATTAARVFRDPEARQTTEPSEQGSSGQVSEFDQESLQTRDKGTSSGKGSAIKRGFQRLSQSIQDSFHKSMENLRKVGSRTHHSKERISNENEDELSRQTTDERERNRGLEDTVQDIWKRPDTVQRMYLTEPDNVATTAARVFRDPEARQTMEPSEQGSSGQVSEFDQESLQTRDKGTSSGKGSAIKRGFQRLSQSIQDSFHKSMENLRKVGSRTHNSKDRIPIENEDELRQTIDEQERKIGLQGTVQDIWKRPDTVQRVSQTETHSANKTAGRVFQIPETRRPSEFYPQGSGGQVPQNEQESLQRIDSITNLEKGNAIKRGFQRFSHSIKDAFQKSVENLHRVGSKIHPSKDRIPHENEDDLKQTSDERDRTRELQDTVQDIWKRPDAVQRVYQTGTDSAEKTAERAFRNPEARQTNNLEGREPVEAPSQDAMNVDQTPRPQESTRGEKIKEGFRRFSHGVQQAFHKSAENLRRIGSKSSHDQDRGMQENEVTSQQGEDVRNVSSFDHTTDEEGVETGSKFKRGVRRLSTQIKDAFHKSMENLRKIGSKTHHSREGSERGNESKTNLQWSDDNEMQSHSNDFESPDMFSIVFDRAMNVADKESEERLKSQRMNMSALPPAESWVPEPVVKRESHRRSEDGIKQDTFGNIFDDVHSPERDHRIADLPERDPYDVSMRLQEPETAERFVPAERSQRRSRDANIDESAFPVTNGSQPTNYVERESQKIPKAGIVQDIFHKSFEDVQTPETHHSIGEPPEPDQYDTRMRLRQAETAGTSDRDERTKRSLDSSMNGLAFPPTVSSEPTGFVKREFQGSSSDDIPQDTFSNPFEDVHSSERRHSIVPDPHDAPIRLWEPETFARDKRSQTRPQDQYSQRIWSVPREPQKVYPMTGNDIPETAARVFSGPEAVETNPEVFEGDAEAEPVLQANDVNENELQNIEEDMESLQKDEEVAQPSVPQDEEKPSDEKQEEEKKLLEEAKATDGEGEPEMQTEKRSLATKSDKSGPPARLSKNGSVRKSSVGSKQRAEKRQSSGETDSVTPTTKSAQSSMQLYLENVKRAAHELRKEVEERAIRKVQDIRRRVSGEKVSASAQTDVSVPVDQATAPAAVPAQAATEPPRGSILQAAAATPPTFGPEVLSPGEKPLSVGCSCPPTSVCRQPVLGSGVPPAMLTDWSGAAGWGMAAGMWGATGLYGASPMNFNAPFYPVQPSPSPPPPPPLPPTFKRAADTKKSPRTPKPWRNPRSRAKDWQFETTDACDPDMPAKGYPFVLFPPSLPPYVSALTDSQAAPGVVPYASNARGRPRSLGARGCAVRELRAGKMQKQTTARIGTAAVAGSACVDANCLDEQSPVRPRRQRQRSLPRSQPNLRLLRSLP